MSSANYQCGSEQRLVGDPIDVVTGANVDAVRDLYLAGEIPFIFRRYYDSSANDQKRGLGWGHSHEFEQHLEFDLDGVRYHLPNGGFVDFDPIEVGEQSVVAGYYLLHTKPNTYLIWHDELTLQFECVNDQLAILSRIGNDPHWIKLKYDKSRTLRQVTDSFGRDLKVTYNQFGLLTSIIWLKGENSEQTLLEYQYDTRGNLQQGTDSYGNQFSFKFDLHNRMIRKIDRRGYQFEFDYDSNGRCVSSKGSDGLHEVHLEYMPDQRATEVTRGDGGNWLYVFNEFGTITEIVDPNGGKTSFNLNDDGQVIEEIGPNGCVKPRKITFAGESLEFDPLIDGSAFRGKPKREYTDLEYPTPPLPADLEFGDLNPVHEFPWQTLERSFASGRAPTRLTDFSNVAEVNGFFETDDGKRYDHHGLLVSEKAPDGTRRWSYDSNGNVVKFTDKEGRTYQFEYTSWNQLSTVIDPLHNRVITEVDGERNRSRLVDPGGHVHAFTYDRKEQLEEVRRFDRTQYQYEYDLAGNLIKKIDSANQILLEQSFDSNNCLQESTTGEQTVTKYQSDEIGRPISIQSENHELELSCSRSGFRKTDKRDGVGIEHSVAGTRILETNILDKFQIKFRWKDRDGIRTVEDPTGHVHQFQSGLQKIVKQLANGSVETTNFSDSGACSRRVLEGKRQDWNRSYKYSPEGDLVIVDDNQKGNIDYEYDDAGRIKSRKLNAKVDRFRYDSAGNILQMPGLTGVEVASGNLLSHTSQEKFEYNHRNSIVSRTDVFETIFYSYDSQDQLISAQRQRDGEKIEFWSCEYDALGRRIKVTVNEKSTVFYWDQDRLAAEVSPDGALRVYIYSDINSFVPFMFIDYESIDTDPEDGARHYIFCNHLGAPVLVEDDFGEVVWNCTYDPFGRCEFTTAKIQFNLRFPGHYFDSATGLQYNRFRYYDPGLGRYIQPDPIGIAGGVNLYGYCHNPLTAVDVFGLNADGCPPGGDPPTPRPRRPRDSIHPNHLQRLIAYARDNGLRIIIREPNPRRSAIPWKRTPSSETAWSPG